LFSLKWQFLITLSYGYGASTHDVPTGIAMC
jgi:hypothetical protein